MAKTYDELLEMVIEYASHENDHDKIKDDISMEDYLRNKTKEDLSVEEYLQNIKKSGKNIKTVIDIEKIYKSKIPSIIQKIISGIFCGSTRFASTTGIRLLTFPEITNPDENFGVDFIKKQMIPLFDFGDNTIGVYDLEESSFCKFDTVDMRIFYKKKELDDFLK